MAQDRGRRGGYGGGSRSDYETDDLKFGDRHGYRGERGHGAAQQRGEAFSRGGWSGEQGGGDYGPGQQLGDWFAGDFADRGYGQGGYGAQEERFRDYDRSRTSGTGHGQGGGSYPNSRQGRSYGGSAHGGGSRSREDHERGFMDKASDEVASWFGDDEAEQRRRQDQHHRGRGPRGYARSDERIREDVNDRLTDDWMLDASDIEVQVSEREVTLSGEVSSREDKRRAEDIAEDISGVTHVQNNLRVRRNDESGGVTGVTL